MKTPTMKVEWWKNEGYWQGGCWALILGDRLFAEAAQTGRHKPTQRRMSLLATMWNRSVVEVYPPRDDD